MTKKTIATLFCASLVLFYLGSRRADLSAKKEQDMIVDAQLPSVDVIEDVIGDKLVRLNDGKLVPYEMKEDIKVYGLYFSAYWCPACKKYSPELVKWYNEFKQKNPSVEIVFVSNDRSEALMRTYMQRMKMPFPALRYDSKKDQAILQNIYKYAGGGMPCLVAVTENGEVLSHTYTQTGFRWPSAVTDDIEAFMNTLK